MLLQHLCRQGRDAVQVTYELDVMATEYIEQEPGVTATTRDTGVTPVDVQCSSQRQATSPHG